MARSYLIVEPDRAYAKLLKDALKQYGDINIVNSAQTAIDYLDDSGHHVDMIITELLLGVRSGAEVINEIRSYIDWINIPVVIHSRVQLPPELNSRELFAQYGIIEYVHKGSNSLPKLISAMSATVTI